MKLFGLLLAFLVPQAEATESVALNAGFGVR